MIELHSPEGLIRVTRDGNGYPNILAPNRLGAAWAKGWLHARDRMGQVLLTRMVSQGRMMELLGPTPAARTVDRVLRLLRLPYGLDEHVAALSDQARTLLETYCLGFEAGRATRKTFDRLLRVGGVDVRPFTPSDVLLGHRMLCFFGLTSSQLIAEQLVVELVQNGADERLIELLLGPASDGIDLDAIRAMKLPVGLELLRAGMGGSNAIAVSAARSATGGALLIADPHLEVGRFPPVVYVTHEEYADGDYAQGLSMPGLPWLTMGRTRDVSLAYTYGHGDNVDIIIERCDNGRCQRADGWETLRRRSERVAVRGRATETWTFWDNAHGSIAAELADGDLPCVRWAGLHEATASDVEAILDMPDCRTVEAMIEVHRRIKLISLGVVCADRDGNIGWVHTGQIELPRSGGTGAYPTPGWLDEGPQTLPEHARPMRINPDEGFICAANELVDGRNGESWVTFPEPPYRHERLREVIGAIERPTMRDLLDACVDETDNMAKRLAPIWAPLLRKREFDDVARWATRQERQQSRADRQRMSLFHALHYELCFALLAEKIGEEQARRALDELGALLSFQSNLDDALALQRPELLDKAALRNLLVASWPRAYARAKSADWSVPLRAKFKSMFEQGALPTVFGFSSAPIDFPGGPTSPFQARIMPFNGERIVGGPAARFVCDMSEDGGWYNVPGGASELPWGPGYATGLEDWKVGGVTALGRKGVTSV